MFTSMNFRPCLLCYVQIMTTTDVGFEGWLYTGLKSGTTEEYTKKPFAWAGSIGMVKYIGDDTRRVGALQHGKTTFADVTWGSHDEKWSTDVTNEYKTILKTFYSLSALRLLAAAHSIDLSSSSSSSMDEVGEKTRIIDSCASAEAPLCSPSYLSAFAQHVRKVAAGDHAGGHDFTHADASGSPASRPSVPGPALGLPGTDQALRDTNARLQRELTAALSTSTTVPQTTQIQAIMAMAMTAFTQQQLSNPSSGDLTLAQKPKTRQWPRIIDEVKASLKSQTTAPVLKLSRQYKDRVEKDSKAADSSHKLMLGNGGACITLPGASIDTGTKSTSYDGVLWTGLSAFFRLFKIMATMPEDDLPRAGLADFMTVWSNLWDSPRGSREMKLKTALAFYDKYAGDLGKLTWPTLFDTDSRLLLEHLEGANPGLCRSCNGSGEASPDVRNGNDGSRSAGGGGGRTRTPRKVNPTKRKRSENFCFSMLDQSASSCTKRDCPFVHGPCPSCGSNCDSAATCAKWDQPKMTATYGSTIEYLKRTKLQSGGRLSGR